MYRDGSCVAVGTLLQERGTLRFSSFFLSLSLREGDSA